MLNINKFQIVGTLGKDPEIVNSKEGESIGCKFSIKTPDKKGKDDKWSGGFWLNVTCWNPFLAKYVVENIVKGNRVYIEGELTQSTYQDKINTSVNIPKFGGGSIQKIDEVKKNKESESKSESIENTDHDDLEIPF